MYDSLLRNRPELEMLWGSTGLPNHRHEQSDDFFKRMLADVANERSRIVEEGLVSCRALRPDLFDPQKYRFMRGFRELENGTNCVLREGLSNATQEYYWAQDLETGKSHGLLEVDTAFGGGKFTFTSRVVEEQLINATS